MHGHLPLTVTNAVFNTLSAIPFVIAVNPSTNPTILVGASGPQIGSLCLTCENQQKLFIKYDNTDKSLKQDFWGAVEAIYLTSIHNKYVGFSTQTYLSMMTYIYTDYAAIGVSGIFK